ncbi:hypothetical protein AD006_19435 [Pseudonocardia sp. EC080610-09]|uniref:hypothetical protein n=1 Tax=Pseudonocardia sp. EC080625-04 TaxID=1096868 RepID=UPI0006CB167B|nr:hypothetical protein FRP1_11520 [Pseudonocardia sp. EC080625-04]ALL76935.1 hypothetical protein AD006_19435 [Pseudonocardia sp. EC080610-09]ALL83966.1 hypothetical protein AD017_27275 [Pseudonocardia sp. EC080619-01]
MVGRPSEVYDDLVLAERVHGVLAAGPPAHLAQPSREQLIQALSAPIRRDDHAMGLPASDRCRGPIGSTSTSVVAEPDASAERGAITDAVPVRYVHGEAAGVTRMRRGDVIGRASRDEFDPSPDDVGRDLLDEFGMAVADVAFDRSYHGRFVVLADLVSAFTADLTEHGCTLLWRYRTSEDSFDVWIPPRMPELIAMMVSLSCRNLVTMSSCGSSCTDSS